jgi:hypothetical protein
VRLGVDRFDPADVAVDLSGFTRCKQAKEIACLE